MKPKPRNVLLPAILMLAGLILAIQNLNYYLNLNFRLIATILIVPVVARIGENPSKSLRFAYLSILFLLLYPFVKIQSLFYFGFCFYLFSIIEIYYGKINLLPILMVILMSPLFVFLFEITGFQIRLGLTALAAKTLAQFNPEIAAMGNTITCGPYEFSMDPACMGLKMVTTGIVLTILFLNYYESKLKNTFKTKPILVIFSILAVLVVLANFFRILAIVMFRSMPGTVSHELIGVFSLLLYALLPIAIVSKKMAYRYLSQAKKQTISENQKPKWRMIPIFVILILLAYNNFTREQHRAETNASSLETINLQGYEKKACGHGVAKFANNNALVYIKPTGRFYNADHTPLICWKGSGYKIKNECIENKNEFQIATAELHLGSEVLYTAWWYENETHKTVYQTNWRWEMLKGSEPYNLINVTCTSKETLLGECGALLKL